MDPRHLIQLATILEKGSITQASRHLHLTQPTLTHNMQILEMQVGGKLFERSRFGVRSTALGDMLARDGRAIARRLKDAAEVSARHRGGLRSALRIGVGPLMGAAFLPEVVEDLLFQQPSMHVTVQSDRPHLLVEQLIDGRHDMVIAPSWLDQPPSGIERLLLVEDDLGVFCSSAHTLAASGVLSPASSEGQGWIALGTASPFDQHVREMLDEAGIVTPRSDITVLGEAMLLLRLLSQGRHLSVLPRFPVLLLQSHFPIVELVMGTRAKNRDIYLWFRTTMLEDRTFVVIKDTVISHATRVGAQRSAALR